MTSKYRNQILNDKSLSKDEKISALMKIPNVGWCFTSYHVDPPILHEKMVCLIYQLEICQKTLAETGEIKHHWQAAFRHVNTEGVKFDTVKKILPPGVHIEPALGLWQDQVKYCSKLYNEDGTQARVNLDVPSTILGIAPSYGEELKKRKACVLTAMCEDLKKGKSLKKLAIEMPAEFVRNHNGLKVFAQMCLRPDEVVHSTGFTRPAPILPDPKSQKHLVFTGPRFQGKTSWLRWAFPKAFYVYQNVEALINWDPTDYDCIIFDDCDLTERSRNEQLQFVQSNVTQTIKIRFHNIVIPQFMPRIFVYNPGNYPFMRDEEAIDIRLIETDLTGEILFE